MKKIILFSMIFTISFYGCTHLRLEHSNPFDPLYSGPAVTNPVIPTNGLMAEWLFNGNADDSSGNGNDGVVYNAVLTNDRFGNIGKAYWFDGVNCYIQINNSFLNPVYSFTFNAWIKINQISSPYSTILSLGSNPGGNCTTLLLRIDATFKLYYVFWYNSTTGIQNYATTPLSTNSNNFISLSYSASEIKIYINGVLDYSVFYNDGALVTNNIYFGADSSYQQGYFSGIIDDVRIYNRALSSNEITVLYTEGGW